jgi:hypothetical protein
VGAIEVPVHPLGGENFKITLNATALAVGEANAEISCRVCRGLKGLGRSYTGWRWRCERTSWSGWGSSQFTRRTEDTEAAPLWMRMGWCWLAVKWWRWQ